jgi:hypothetical protein
LLGGCDSSKNPADQGPSGKGPPVLKADPNPVPAGPGNGTTRITWDTGDARSTGQVYVSRDGKPENLFAEGIRGTKEARWIQKGFVYEFRLYAGRDHVQLLARIKVRRAAK